LASSLGAHTQVQLTGRYLVPLRGGLNWHE
jgi:hypothetical protein